MDLMQLEWIDLELKLITYELIKILDLFLPKNHFLIIILLNSSTMGWGHYFRIVQGILRKFQEQTVLVLTLYWMAGWFYKNGGALL
jgi:hypothetical protein